MTRILGLIALLAISLGGAWCWTEARTTNAAMDEARAQLAVLLDQTERLEPETLRCRYGLSTMAGFQSLLNRATRDAQHDFQVSIERARVRASGAYADLYASFSGKTLGSELLEMESESTGLRHTLVMACGQFEEERLVRIEQQRAAATAARSRERSAAAARLAQETERFARRQQQLVDSFSDPANLAMPAPAPK